MRVCVFNNIGISIMIIIRIQETCEQENLLSGDSEEE